MGLLDDIGEFFTGNNAKRARRAVREQQRIAKEMGAQGSNITSKGTRQAIRGAEELAKSAADSRANAKLLNQQRNEANMAVGSSLGANAAETSRMANESARENASQNADLSSMQAARRAISAARTGGLNQGQAALAAGQNVGQNYTGAYQEGIGQGLNQYNTAVGQQQNRASSLAGQTVNEESLANQAQSARGGIGSSLAATGSAQQANAVNAGLNAAAQKTAQANTQGAAGGAFTGSVLNRVDDMGKQAAQLAQFAAMKDGTESAPGGPTIVGEEGPEIVELPAGARVVSNPQLRKIARISGARDGGQLRKIIKKNPGIVSSTPAQVPNKGAY